MSTMCACVCSGGTYTFVHERVSPPGLWIHARESSCAEVNVPSDSFPISVDWKILLF